MLRQILLLVATVTSALVSVVWCFRQCILLLSTVAQCTTVLLGFHCSICRGTMRPVNCPVQPKDKRASDQKSQEKQTGVMCGGCALSDELGSARQAWTLLSTTWTRMSRCRISRQDGNRLTASTGVGSFYTDLLFEQV